MRTDVVYFPIDMLFTPEFLVNRWWFGWPLAKPRRDYRAKVHLCAQINTGGNIRQSIYKSFSK